MKYNYKFEALCLFKEEPDYIDFVIDLDKEVLKEGSILEDFLVTDIGKDLDVGEELIKELDKVIKGELKFLDWNGNVCCLEVEKEMAKVIHLYRDESENDTCLIETEELKELIRIWMDGYKRFQLEGENWIKITKRWENE